MVAQARFDVVSALKWLTPHNSPATDLALVPRFAFSSPTPLRCLNRRNRLALIDKMLTNYLLATLAVGLALMSLVDATKFGKSKCRLDC